MIKRFDFFEQVERLKRNEPLIESDNICEDIKKLKKQELDLLNEARTRKNMYWDLTDTKIQKDLGKIRNDIYMLEKQRSDNK